MKKERKIEASDARCESAIKRIIYLPMIIFTVYNDASVFFITCRASD